MTVETFKLCAVTVDADTLNVPVIGCSLNWLAARAMIGPSCRSDEDESEGASLYEPLYAVYWDASATMAVLAVGAVVGPSIWTVSRGGPSNCRD